MQRNHPETRLKQPTVMAHDRLGALRPSPLTKTVLQSLVVRWLGERRTSAAGTPVGRSSNTMGKLQKNLLREQHKGSFAR